MQDMPQPIPGPDLAAQRKALGIKQVELAARLGIHRITLGDIERLPSVDPIRAARYQRAMREIVQEAVA